MKTALISPRIPASVLVGLLAITSAVLAQTRELPPLEALRAPKNAAWSVTYNYTEEAPQAEDQAARPGRIKILSVQKEGDVYHELKVFDNGRKTERWILKGIQFETKGDQKEATRLLPGDPEASDYSESDFPDLAWVVGLKPRPVRMENGVVLLVVEVNAAERPLTAKEKREKEMMEDFTKQYSKMLEKTRDKDLPAGAAALIPLQPKPQGVIRLFLNPKTKLPVRYESTQETRSYSFPTDFQPLRPPENFQGAYKTWSSEMMASTRPPSEP
jgi:hypothetical protein